MIQQEAILQVADNSGPEEVKCIKVIGGTRRRYAGVGDTIVCSVRKTRAGSNVKKGDVVKAVIVRTRAPVHRQDGQTLRFDTNSVVILGAKADEPLGTRVFGPVAREVRDAGHLKICSLAPEVV